MISSVNDFVGSGHSYIGHGLNVTSYTTFGESLFDALESTPPPLDPVNLTSKAPQLVFWRAESTTPRPDLITMDFKNMSLFREAHSSFLAHSKNITVPYQQGSQGIVSTSPGALFPVFLLSLRMLRRTGCTLPVELFVDTAEYDNVMCTDVFPALNAHCIRLDTLLPAAHFAKLAKYQLKIFSILFSSFEDVFLLDVDNILTQDPTPLFSISGPTPPFRDHGLVLWPDFWASSASPIFYDIASIRIPPLTARASAESGQLLVSKRRMGRALLMSAYYNFYGPDLYYTLLTQGGPGEGDKETFAAGAEAVAADEEWWGNPSGLDPGPVKWGEKARRRRSWSDFFQRRDDASTVQGRGVYQVSKGCDTVGYYDPVEDSPPEDSTAEASSTTPEDSSLHQPPTTTLQQRDDKKGRYHGLAMLQYDPLQDLFLARESIPTTSPTPSSISHPHLRPFSLHHNIPKLDPNILFAPHNAWDPMKGAAKALHPVPGARFHRLWGDEQTTLERFGGKDVEREMWEEMEVVSCGFGDKFEFWRVGEGVCEGVREFRREIFGDDDRGDDGGLGVGVA